MTNDGIVMISIEGPNASEIPPETFGRSCSGRVVVRGPGNRIEIGKNCKLTAVQIDLHGKNNRLIIGDDVLYRGHILIASGSNQTVRIGARSTFQNVYLLCSEGRNITIGEECMFSREIEVRTTDAHSVIDVATGQRINAPGDITIGDHVWVGLRAIIQPGVHIARRRDRRRTVLRVQVDRRKLRGGSRGPGRDQETWRHLGSPARVRTIARRALAEQSPGNLTSRTFLNSRSRRRRCGSTARPAERPAASAHI